jgi:hypothetical protein
MIFYHFKMGTIKKNMFFILFFNYLHHFCFKTITQTILKKTPLLISINSIELFILKFNAKHK